MDRTPPEIPLRVSRLAGGGFRIAAPSAPGFAQIARTPVELARAFDAVLREAECANYAKKRGVPYDVGQLERRRSPGRPRTGANGKRRYPEPHDPSAWSPLEDGSWRSPSGRIYKPTTKLLDRVKAARAQLNLPNDYSDL